MRFFPILTAILATIAIYFALMQRAELINWLGLDGPDAETSVNSALTPTKAISVVAVQSSAKPIPDGILLRGRTEAARRVTVTSETSGKVTSEPLPKGTRVAAGDVLCKLDPGTRPEQLVEAMARLENAQVGADNAASLAAGGFGPDTAIVATKSALEAAKTGVARIESDIAHLEITAPFAGILETDTTEIGSLIQPGSPCAKIIALDQIKLVGFATEQDITRLSVGVPAGGRLVSGREVKGTVTFLANSSDPVTRTFRVEITVANADLSIREGETAEIFIALGTQQAHLLPNNVLTLNDKGALGIRAVDGKVARFMPVELMRDSADGVWLKGLPETVDVITVGQDFVVDGSPIAATFAEVTQ